MSLSSNPEPEGATVPTLSLAEAERLGYTLGADACGERLGIRRGELFRMLATGDLPSVRARTRRGSAYRVRPQDLEELLARVCVPSPPADLIRETYALEILAGQPVRSGTTPGGRMRQRLYAAVERGSVVRYRLLGRSRYSRREVEFERDRLAARGVGTRATTPRTHHLALRKGMETEGLVDTRTASQRVGVPQSTAAGWAARGLYGARKLAGQWWFVADLLPSSPPSARHEPGGRVPCARCGRPHERPAWEVRAATEKGRRLYCPDCWTEIRDQVTGDNLAKGRGRKFTHSEETRVKMSASAVLRWERATAEERAAKRGALAIGHDKLLRSGKRRVAMTSKIVLARQGREPTEEERRRWSTRAKSRAATGRAGPKPKGDVRDQLLEIAAAIAATYGDDFAGFGQNEILAEIGLHAWQQGVGTFRHDFPAGASDPESFDRQYRKVILERVRMLIGPQVKALQIAAI